jgi:hypothetical protein
MSAIAEDRGKKTRRPRLVAGQVGVRLVMDELSKRGFDAQLVSGYAKQNDVLVGRNGAPPTPVHVRAVNVGPWYVRSSHFAGAVRIKSRSTSFWESRTNRIVLVFS